MRKEETTRPLSLASDWLMHMIHNSSDSWTTSDVDMALSGMITLGLIVVLIGEILVFCYNY